MAARCLALIGYICVVCFLEFFWRSVEREQSEEMMGDVVLDELVSLDTC
jgi:hypothetical protein